MRVIDKPAGLPVHASAKFYFNTLTRVLVRALSRRARAADLPPARSRDLRRASCVARDREAAAFLKDAFAPQGPHEKEYLAIVHGQPPWDAGRDRRLPLRPRLSTEAIRRACRTCACCPTRAGCRRSRACASSSAPREHALVRCTLVTGRQHQIRAHLAARRAFRSSATSSTRTATTRSSAYCDEGLDARARRAVRDCRATRCTPLGSPSRTPRAVPSQLGHHYPPICRCC